MDEQIKQIKGKMHIEGNNFCNSAPSVSSP